MRTGSARKGRNKTTPTDADGGIRVVLPAYHDGQVACIEASARYNNLRCGRRFGKSTMGAILTAETALDGYPAAWFGPEYQYLQPVWDMLVEWLDPIIKSQNSTTHRITLTSGGSIDLWSLKDGSDAGRGRKYKLVVYDEAGIIPNLKQSWTRAVRPTLADMKGSAWFLGTSKPGYPFFNDLFLRGDRVAGWKSFQMRSIDNPAIDPAEIEDARVGMPDWQAAEEFDGQPSEMGLTFFSQAVIDKHKAEYGCEPVRQGEFVLPTDQLELDRIISRRDVAGIVWRDNPRKGVWKLWVQLAGKGGGRPRPGRNIVIGADPSNGVGAANAVLSVADADSKRMIAEYACPGVSPERLAHIAAAAGWWFGGAGEGAPCALINFERNGPGEAFVRELRRLRYPKIVRKRIEGTANDRNTDEFGWWNTNTSKGTLLSEYRADLAAGRFQNPSDVSLDECMTYIEDQHGRIVSVEETELDESGAQKPHADRCIAAALANAAMKRMAKLDDGTLVPAPTSLARLRARQKPKSDDDWEPEGEES